MTYQFKPGMYKTRDGRDARVLCDDAPGDWPLVGYVGIDEGYFCYSWTHSGHSTSDKTKHQYGLMPPREVAWTLYANKDQTWVFSTFHEITYATHRITYYTDGECVVERL